jgi:hypothetical protein
LVVWWWEFLAGVKFQCAWGYTLGIPFWWCRKTIYGHWFPSPHLATWLGPFITCQGGLPGLPLWCVTSLQDKL